jgi:Ni/Co efflux regulator RcnB
MKIQASAALMSIVLVTALGGCAGSSEPSYDRPISRPIQYSQYPDQRSDPYYYPQDRYYQGDRRGGYYDGPLWRPGDVLPPSGFDYVVDDWGPRGLVRPPGGHLWVRVGYQFILVRERDRMISRVINFG